MSTIIQIALDIIILSGAGCVILLALILLRILLILNRINKYLNLIQTTYDNWYQKFELVYYLIIKPFQLIFKFLAKK